MNTGATGQGWNDPFPGRPLTHNPYDSSSGDEDYVTACPGCDAEAGWASCIEQDIVYWDNDHNYPVTGTDAVNYCEVCDVYFDDWGNTLTPPTFKD